MSSLHVGASYIKSSTCKWAWRLRFSGDVHILVHVDIFYLAELLYINSFWGLQANKPNSLRNTMAQQTQWQRNPTAQPNQQTLSGFLGCCVC